MVTPTAIEITQTQRARVERLGRKILRDCIATDRSLLVPKARIWTPENLAELHRRLIDTPPGNRRSFRDRARRALTGASGPVRQLFAEVVVLHNLPLSEQIAKPATTLRAITDILKPLDPAVSVPAAVQRALTDGPIDGSRAWVSRRWVHLRVLVAFAEHFKAQKPAIRKTAQADPTLLRELMFEAPADPEPALRQALLYLLRSDYFLPLVVQQDRRQRHRDAHRNGRTARDATESRAVTRFKYHPMAPGTYLQSSPFQPPDRPTHNGIDFAADLGTPIYAPADGFFHLMGPAEGFGFWLVLDAQEQWGLDFVFGHMPNASLINPDTGARWTVGDRVRAGQQIAVVGNEGESSGPHLHFETWSPPGRNGGSPLNPAQSWLSDAHDPRQAAADGAQHALAHVSSDAFPLPPNFYWGPIDGPDESLSNRNGTEPQYSFDGLKRWQATLGLPETAVYDDITKAACTAIQRAQGWSPTGTIGAREWDAVIRAGWRPAPGQQWPPPPVLSTADGYAQAIIAEGLRRSITARGIKIALATALVETNMRMYANSKDDASMLLPHDAVGSDGMSVGLFQQQNFAEWKSLECRMDAACSAGSFYEHLVEFDYNNEAETPGSYADRVQRSKFPERYDHRFDDATALYDRLIGTVGADVGAAPLDPDRWPLPPGIYWGPAEGPDESWSNTAGTEPQFSKDGLRRWQTAVGIPASGIYDGPTKNAATQLQHALGRTVDGCVHELDWTEVILRGWRPPSPRPRNRRRDTRDMHCGTS